MLPADLSRQVRQLRLRVRRALDSPLSGIYRSVFRGPGLIFDEVREYQPGDDVRAIDWNVTARAGRPYVKRFIEERELTMVLVVDTSASMGFGSQPSTKRDVAVELAAILALCAVANHDRVGLLLCSDRVEKFVPPKKGMRHALRLIRDVFVSRAEASAGTLRPAVGFLQRALRQRSLLFFLSDFFDDVGEAGLRRLNTRHDTIALVLDDPAENAWPDVGLFHVRDVETGQSLLIDTHDPQWQARFQQAHLDRVTTLQRAFRRARVDALNVSTQGDWLHCLIHFFQTRAARLKSWQ